MGRNIQQFNKNTQTPRNILLLYGKPRSSEVKELQYTLLLVQFTLNTAVDLGGGNLVPHYTRELQVLHSELPILVKLPIPIIHLKL